MSPRAKLALAAVVLAATGLSAGYAVRRSLEGATAAAGAWPRAGELDSLSGYLRSDGGAEPRPLAIARTRLEGGASSAPEAAPFWDELGPTEAPAADPAPRAARAPARPVRRLSAVLITGSRRVAIIDDVEVRPGDGLAGGATVVSIDADRVVVRERDGSRVVLRLGDSGAPDA